MWIPQWGRNTSWLYYILYILTSGWYSHWHHQLCMTSSLKVSNIISNINLHYYYVLCMKGGYGYSSEYFMGKDLKDINLTRIFKTWWQGAIDKEMTLKDWGLNPSGGSFLPGFLWPFRFVLHFLPYFFTDWLASIYSYCCPITALRGVAINALSTFYVCDLFKFSLHYFLISLVKRSSFSLGHRTMFC